MHVLGANEVPRTNAGRQVLLTALQKRTRQAATALLAVAILQGLYSVIFIFIGLMAVGDPSMMSDSSQWANQPAPEHVEVSEAELAEASFGVITGTLVGLTLLFFGLYLWARRNPFPAAVVGLVVFLSLHLLSAIIDPITICSGILIKVIIVAVLIKAVHAGYLHRQLRQRIESPPVVQAAPVARPA